MLHVAHLRRCGMGITNGCRGDVWYHTTMDDTPRPVATTRDSSYSLTIEEAADLYAKAGHPRTLRTMQRYCASGHLDSVKAATTLGDKYYVSPQSVARHLAQIKELDALDHRATDRDLSRPGAAVVAAQTTGDMARQGSATSPDVSLLVAATAPENAAPPARPITTRRDLSRRRQHPRRHLSRQQPTAQRSRQGRRPHFGWTPRST